MPRVAPGPAGFQEKCPGEPWSIWVHRDPRDFEQDSFGATAGFMTEGTPVQVLKHWPNFALQSEGPTPMVKVRGLNENGRQITGWTRTRHIEGLP